MDALKRFEVENSIEEDGIYHHNQDEQNKILAQKPWTRDPHYFKKVKISAIALIKMVAHCRSGGDIEVMGLMQGRIDGDTMIVMDAFALPVEGTETRVTAQSEGYEYMVQYTRISKMSVAWKMSWVGTTVILDTDAGCQESMLAPKCSTKSFKSHSALLWYLFFNCD